MPEIQNAFSQEIEENKNSDHAPNLTIDLSTEKSHLSIRERGGFIVDCELTSGLTGERHSILYSDSDLTVPKLTASHIMSPVGPTTEIGGQHGYARWADYHEFPLNDDTHSGSKRVAIQAKRSDNGAAIAKTFELVDSSLTTQTTLFNSGGDSSETSLGEHLYFSLPNEDFDGLKVDGKSLDELLGEGSEKAVKAGSPIFWDGFSGQVSIIFPAGYSIRLSVNSVGGEAATLGMLVWHRPGSSSVCFEPTLGFEGPDNNGLVIEPNNSVTLSTEIELE